MAAILLHLRAGLTMSNIFGGQLPSTPDRFGNCCMLWLSNGLNKLPKIVADIEYSDDFTCTALIYEFEKTDQDQYAKINIPGKLAGKVHLSKANVWTSLERGLCNY